MPLDLRKQVKFKLAINKFRESGGRISFCRISSTRISCYSGRYSSFALWPETNTSCIIGFEPFLLVLLRVSLYFRGGFIVSFGGGDKFAWTRNRVPWVRKKFAKTKTEVTDSLNFLSCAFLISAGCYCFEYLLLLWTIIKIGCTVKSSCSLVLLVR